MKIVVAMDGDGHFMASPYTDREKVTDIINKIQDGDFVANMDPESKEIFEDKLSTSDFEWKNLIYGLEQRGTLEIIEI
jgi:hypothetical protein